MERSEIRGQPGRLQLTASAPDRLTPDFAALHPGYTQKHMHELDIFHEHLMTEEERAEIARYIWNQENVELATIGIDIGSSTSHLLFAKVLLQRQSQGLSSRFAVVHRQVIWRSPIVLTPFLPDGTIDAAKLGVFISDCYREAGLAPEDRRTRVMYRSLLGPKADRPVRLQVSGRCRHLVEVQLRGDEQPLPARAAGVHQAMRAEEPQRRV